MSFASAVTSTRLLLEVGFKSPVVSNAGLDSTEGTRRKLRHALN